MRSSEQIQDLAAALAKAQGKIKPAPKDSLNPHFRSHYADLSSIMEACRGPLSENGLSIAQGLERLNDGQVQVVTRLLHASGQWLESSVSVMPMKQDAQGVGAAATYLRRYGLSSLIGVTSEEDDDGNKASEIKEPIKVNPEKQVTIPQIQRLAAIGKARGWKNEDLTRLVRVTYSVQSKDLKMGQYEEIVKFVENNGPESLSSMKSDFEKYEG